MNRADFMEQLNWLLQSIPSAEREEALQYYNDYFDDAGPENEQAVIRALGNPARVAENIRRDLTESGTPTRAKASDEALVEYGKAYEEESPREGQDAESKSVVSVQTGEAARGVDDGSAYRGEAARGVGGGSAYRGEAARGVDGGSAYRGEAAHRGDDGSVYRAETAREAQASSGSPGRGGRGLPAWAILLIIAGAFFASPVVIGLLSTLFGLAVCWFALIFSVGAVALALFILLVVFIVVGIMCFFVDPLSGVAMIGAGLIVGGLGLLFLMLTVAMAGIVTPAIFRGIGRLFRWRRA
ncbi:MAG: DUF1700 domain-containing protein [Roseburia sp.]|nr:DUF1700 domain-containing protein [Roseburia sp.]MCM1099294.1 DUF1700 domain-containing protein [Ruminococcus flavefaciens]